MNKQQLIAQIKAKRSFLCVGLDTDIDKIPVKLPYPYDEGSRVFQFNQAIIKATAPYAVAYKLNFAFYESRGVVGYQDLEKNNSLYSSALP